MHNQPSVIELLQAVQNFVDKTAAPNLKGHAAFHARVASNALSTAIRDLEARPDADKQERARLQTLLHSAETDLEALNQQLCDKIKSGEMTLASEGLLSHLKTTTKAQVEVDQPRYSGLKTAKS